MTELVRRCLAGERTGRESGETEREEWEGRVSKEGFAANCEAICKECCCAALDLDFQIPPSGKKKNHTLTSVVFLFGGEGGI